MQTAVPTPSPHTATDSPRDRIRGLLERTRRRTLELVEPLSERALNEVHDSLLSPIVWDLGHVAKFEEQWILQQACGRRPLRMDLSEVYDPFSTPRSKRGELAYLKSENCLRYMTEVRERVLAALKEAELDKDSGPLLEGGFIFDLVARHEQQHSETILQTLQVMTSEPYRPPEELVASLPSSPGDDRGRLEGMVVVEGGPFEMGASGSGFSFDNERQSHVREVAPFWIDVAPVTNAAMIEFILDGGYSRRGLWSEQGWDWREREGVVAPKYWEREGEQFVVRRFADKQPVEPSKPVCHVSWHEAGAYACWAGKRLPTEPEWEKAAAWDESKEAKQTYPWGEQRPGRERANLDQLSFGPHPVGTHPQGESPCGAQQMVGDVWEWTASAFERYEGFEAFAYREYSEPFFGPRFKVLRGGAWATQPEAVTATFRNWDFPERRQVFAGFRCALDADPGEPASAGAFD